jgi:hypothetical protein
MLSIGGFEVYGDFTAHNFPEEEDSFESRARCVVYV